MRNDSRLIEVSRNGRLESAALRWASPPYNADLLQQDILSPAAFGGPWTSIRFPGDWTADLHEDPLYDEYIHLTEGSLTLVLEEREIPVHAGDSVVMHRGTRHGWRTGSEGATLVVFALPESAAREAPGDRG